MSTVDVPTTPADDVVLSIAVNGVEVWRIAGDAAPADGPAGRIERWARHAHIAVSEAHAALREAHQHLDPSEAIA